MAFFCLKNRSICNIEAVQCSEEMDYASKGTSINGFDVFWPFLTYLPTMSDDFYSITSEIWGFLDPLPNLKSDLIYGLSTTSHLEISQENCRIKSFDKIPPKSGKTVK